MKNPLPLETHFDFHWGYHDEGNLLFNVGFHFLTDKNNSAAKQLGILDKGALPLGFQLLRYDSDVVMPTVIITDKSGKIIFVDLTDNYRVRPEPETFLKILDEVYYQH